MPRFGTEKLTELITYAKWVALDPPIAVYQALTKLASEAQLKDLGGPPPEPKDPKAANYQAQLVAWNLYNKTKKEVQEFADNWGKLVKEYGEASAEFKLTSICDFTAMSMMMIAAGSARVEALKTAIRGRTQAGSIDTASKDHAHVFDRSGAAKFRAAVDTWCNLEKSGILQFKFPANGALHTFAVERIPVDKGKPEFIVYQSYEGTYTLSHFLNTQGIWNDSTLFNVHKQRWAEMSDSDKKEYNGDYSEYRTEVVLPQLRNIELAMKWIGAGQRLDYDTLDLRVLYPLEDMLSGSISSWNYLRMTGSPATSKTFSAPYLIVLMCDYVTPSDFEANGEALYACPKDLTEYASCNISIR
jgi:hypothetical protein